MVGTDITQRQAEKWQAENVRLTVFSHELPGTDLRGLWDRVVGEAPEQVNEKPGQGLTVVEGPYDGDNLRLTVRPGMADWRRFARLEGSAPPEGLPTIGPVSSVLPNFLEAMNGWLEGAPGLEPIRIAVGAVLLQEVLGHEEGYEQICKYLPFDFRTPGVSDFSFRVNRPRQTTLAIPGLRVNRLSSWSVAALRVIALTLDGATDVRDQHVLQGPYACRLELDVNTAPDYGKTLPKEHISAILQELGDLCLETAAKGDRE